MNFIKKLIFTMIEGRRMRIEKQVQNYVKRYRQ